MNELVFFFFFLLFIFLILLIDLGVFNPSRKFGHEVSSREALYWTSAWVSLAFVFFGLLFYRAEWIHGINDISSLQNIIALYQHPIDIKGLSLDDALILYRKNLALEYLSGYLIEYALSMDNVFVMVMIFFAFNVEKKYYHRVLFWGIIGAVVMRFLFIFLSAALIQEFSWILILFGLLLIFTGVKMFLSRNKEEKVKTEDHPVVKFASRFFSVYPGFYGHKFIIRHEGKKMITVLFLVLLVVEFTDLIFAVDSVPAIFSVTKDPYIVFFSNIFAIIGLRSLFFLLINVIDKFHFLKIGLSVLLTYIGLKMLFGHYLKLLGFTTAHSLYVIVAILGISVLASLIFPKKIIAKKE